jgi:hypothetical protein
MEESLRILEAARAVRVPVHQHALVVVPKKGGFSCDGDALISSPNTTQQHGKRRWRCAAGCDFDLCAECVAKTDYSVPRNLLPREIPLALCALTTLDLCFVSFAACCFLGRVSLFSVLLITHIFSYIYFSPRHARYVAGAPAPT